MKFPKLLIILKKHFLNRKSFNYLLVHSPSQKELENSSLIEENEILNTLTHHQIIGLTFP